LAPAKALNIILLVTHVWILMNLEQTFRAAVGTMRWQIKFVVLGLAVVFGSRGFTFRARRSLFDVRRQWLSIESSGLLIGCGILLVPTSAPGSRKSTSIPSRAVLSSSVTVLIAGYLFIVGVLARVASSLGGAEDFQLQTLVVLLGVAGLALLLFSDRLRQRVHGFVDRHFARANTIPSRSGPGCRKSWPTSKTRPDSARRP
jgi:cytochrome bd-type quinol oxidase subunit 2